MSVLSISALNSGWGICGFASALGVMYKRNKNFAGIIDAAATAGQLDTRLLAEIKSYLVMLQAEGNVLLLNEIVRFTRSFGGRYAAFTIENYIAKVNTIGSVPPNPRDPGFSIAMPPNGVCDYMRRIGGMKAVLVQGSSLNLAPVVLGLGTPGKAHTEWRGLKHWVLKENDSVVYNWGKKTTFENLMKIDGKGKWEVVYQIAFG